MYLVPLCIVKLKYKYNIFSILKMNPFCSIDRYLKNTILYLCIQHVWKCSKMKKEENSFSSRNLFL